MARGGQHPHPHPAADHDHVPIGDAGPVEGLWVPTIVSPMLTWCPVLNKRWSGLYIWLHEGLTVRHCQYPCHYDSPT